jgi:hypothetical protein
MKIAKPEETKAMYEKNRKLLTPWLQNSVDKISEEELQKKIEVTYNNEGYPVCFYHHEKKCFHITSNHPVLEAKKWFQSIQTENTSEIYLYGTGFGYALFELFAHKAPNTLVIVFEQDIYLFKAMLYYFDISPLLQTGKFAFLVGDSSYFNRAFDEIATKLFNFSVTYPTIVVTLPAARNFKKEYLEIHEYVFKELAFLAVLLGNSHLDIMLGLRNLIANVKVMIENPYISCLKEKYKNVPAFIISNGPSLDRSIQKLKNINGKALIICVESAIVPLTKSGINPDILAVVERTETTYQYHFKGRHYSPDISLLSLAVADPKVWPSFSGEKIPIFRDCEELNIWFNRYLGDGESLDSGSNVSHLATALAMYLCADPIIFVGQDCAYGPEGITHSKDAVISQSQGKAARDLLHSYPTIYVEGNNGKMIPSNQLWSNLRIGLEHIFEYHPEHHFYNATEGGAKIRGTKWIELTKAIEEYCTKPIPYRVNKLIEESKTDISIEERSSKLKNFIAEMRNYSTLFRNLAKETNLKKLECQNMVIICAAEDSEESRRVQNETYRKNIDLFYKYNKDTLFHCFFKQLNCSYFYLLGQLGSIDSQEKKAEAFAVQGQFFRDLRVVCQSVSVTFEEASETLESLSDAYKKAVKNL